MMFDRQQRIARAANQDVEIRQQGSGGADDERATAWSRTACTPGHGCARQGMGQRIQAGSVNTDVLALRTLFVRLSRRSGSARYLGESDGGEASLPDDCSFLA